MSSYCHTITLFSGGSKGGARDAPPRGSKFFQFHAVFGKIRQIRMLAPPWGVGAPSSGKSWVRHWHWTCFTAQQLIKTLGRFGDWANFVFWVSFSKILKLRVQGFYHQVHWLKKPILAYGINMPRNNQISVFLPRKRKSITQNKNLPNFFKNLPQKYKICPVAEYPPFPEMMHFVCAWNEW